MLRNKLIVYNVCFGFSIVLLFLRYHGKPRKEATVIMHLLVSKKKKNICHTSNKILFLM